MASLAQQALDIAADLASSISGGTGISDKQVHAQLAAAVQLLAQSILGATPVVDALTPGAVVTDVATTVATQVGQQ